MEKTLVFTDIVSRALTAAGINGVKHLVIRTLEQVDKEEVGVDGVSSMIFGDMEVGDE